MKKVISLFLAIIMVLFSITACSDEGNTGETVDKSTEGAKEITLTKENITDYLAFDGEYIDWETSKMFPGMDYYQSDAKLDFQAYAIQSGEFRDVRITLTDWSNIGWRLSSDDDKSLVEISFKVSSNGEFSRKYSVTKPYMQDMLDSPRFSVESVSGVFIPKN